ncbi:MAG: 16S rRNA (guanine(527)-N(7))-methyltransferase RsmG [Oscillospiraceae bacterium]|nr:16S rRNA (guanine(527)-N(7))-methyltransferase RsmG [Oscillospiraceae bacterium]
MEQFQEYLKARAAGEGFSLTDGQLADFQQYATLLVDWNNRMNLTAITAPQEIAVKHFLDSIMLLRYAPLPEGSRMIDVGTGAGFPAVPIKTVRPDLKVTLLDSLNKRITFLSALSEALGQDNTCIHARAEEGGRKPELREQFDLATARAVAPMRLLAEYCLPYVKQGGLFVAMKGPDVEAELEEAKPAIKLLGGKIQAVEAYQLAEEFGRSVIIIKKISQTPTKYPRPSAKIAKAPL